MRTGSHAQVDKRAASQEHAAGEGHGTADAGGAAEVGSRARAPTKGRRMAIAVGLADVRDEPDAASELVTQARLWTEAIACDECDGWIRVRLPDYEGWVRGDQVGRSTRWVTPWVAVVTAHLAPIFAAFTGTRQVLTAPVTAVLPVRGEAATGERGDGERVAVRLPGGRKGWMRRADVVVRTHERPFPPGGPPVALRLAHALLGTPYVWGGTSPRGIDCSGLAQLCYRQAGCALPRDAGQQFAALSYIVERGDHRPGDLIFFAEHGEIDHVGISLGGLRVLNARMSAGKVVIDALEVGEPDYSSRLASMYAGARRPMPEWVERSATDPGAPV